MVTYYKLTASQGFKSFNFIIRRLKKLNKSNNFPLNFILIFFMNNNLFKLNINNK
jgi:hypothetical protein